ncbi:DNA-binding transcriptional regulator, LysR family [Malonomonas rubra DSM 5091]|uniref:DNA-binding transcriptional regulator, LysR family n=1 Tax=Malonomonas rubra DSM 5091 TaxID=1122189 RepID=A0A1M6HBY2_MALRU|nr:LysR family transcriptional regulator [Malonomonas rubra]SHJ19712.1 DNA-binding transcriptional regulator, LysR family [Malonomonas rubra DSM 5091]
MLPDFNRLKVFYYIYTENSIVAASRLLHLTQPAVSQQLQKLESELQTRLFIRLHKKLVPTEAAQRLFALVQPFVDSLQDGLEDIAQPLDRPAGLLRIGAPREFGKEYLPFLGHSFRQSYPEVRFRFSFDENVPLLEMLKNGDLDFVLVDVFMSKGQFVETPHLFNIDPLVDEELILACSKDYYQREIQRDHSFANLVAKDYISDEDELMFLNHWFRHHFKKVPAKLNLVMTTDSHEALISGIRLGMGLGQTSTHLVYEELTCGEIVPITTSKKNALSWTSLVQLQDKVPSLTEKTFITHLKQGIRQEEVMKRFVKSSP